VARGDAFWPLRYLCFQKAGGWAIEYVKELELLIYSLFSLFWEVFIPPVLADGKGEGCDIYCGLLQISASSTLHEKFKVFHHVMARQLLTEKWLDSPRKQSYARMPGRPLHSHSKYSGAKTTRYEARSYNS
jgi:hypothetical protein